MTILYRGKQVFSKLKSRSTFQVMSGNVQVDSGDVAAGGGIRAATKISGGDGLNLASGNLNVRSGNLVVGGTTTLAGVASFTAGMATPGKISGGDGLNLASGPININSGNLVVGGTTALRGNVINTVTMSSGNLAVQSGTATVGGLATFAAGAVVNNKISGADTLTLASGDVTVTSGWIIANQASIAGQAAVGSLGVSAQATLHAGSIVKGRMSGGATLNLASGDVLVNSGGLSVGGGADVLGTAYGLVVLHRISGSAGLNLASGDLNVRSGDISIGGHSNGKVFVANHFLCPAPGTDWTPSSGGILLGIGKASKYAWMPLDFLKVGDEITGYKLVGSFEGSVTSATIDSALVRVDLGGSGPVRTVPASGSMVQGVASSTWVSNSVTLNAAEVVAVNKHYQIEIQGTTSVSQQATVYQAEVTVNRKV